MPKHSLSAAWFRIKAIECHILVEGAQSIEAKCTYQTLSSLYERLADRADLMKSNSCERQSGMGAYARLRIDIEDGHQSRLS